MLQYALIVGDPAMINVNVFGLITNLAYISVYYTYSNEKVKLILFYFVLLYFIKSRSDQYVGYNVVNLHYSCK